MSGEVYTYFTAEVISEFQSGGMESLMEVLESYEESNPDSEDPVALLFTELILAFEDTKLELENIVQFLSQSITNDELARIFCQVLNAFPATENLQKLLVLISRKENVIKPETLALHIGSDFLKESDIVPKAIYTKTLNSRIRDEFYTQKKFNLLHEETEGYAKFVVEIYSIFRNDGTEFKIDYALQIIEKLIGHYSLDPNRCLDILLHIFDSVFGPKTSEALTLLRKSRWWPAVESDSTSISNLSIGGNENAAKILGLRIMKCTSIELPEGFKLVVSCLIKEGFISFGSIYKYMLPNEESMSELEKEYQKKLDEEVSKAGANALALAAPLADEEEEGQDKNGVNGEKSTKVEPKEKKSIEEMLSFNHKFQFLKMFLSNGVYGPAIFMLAKYPFLAQINSEIASLLNRLFDAMIQPLYEQVRIFPPEDLQDLKECKMIAFNKPHNGVFYEPVTYTNLLTFRPNVKNFSQRKYHYFYTAWTDKLPIVNDVESFIRVSKEFLKLNGLNIAQNTQLFIKICEIVLYDLKHNSPDEARKVEWFHYFRNFIFPVISLIEENSIAIDKAYSILSLYPIEDRFSVYGELYSVLAKKNPLIKMAYNKAEKSTKDVLKRLSKENVRPMMRRLAKISFSNPLPCLLTILQQIESYDNLNTLVVETARYFSSYGWDNLTVAILMRLTAAGRNATHDDGMIERQWIQSLASFIGKICQRYPRAIDIKTILSFLLKSFHSGDTIGLLVLKEMFISMGGIQLITNLTLHQIDMINCGASLEKVVYRTIDDLRYDRFASGKHLVKCFLELDAINELLVLLVQITNEVIYDSDKTHLKVLASRTDDLTMVIRLFNTLVGFFGDPEEIKEKLLPLDVFFTKHDVPMEWSFELWRPTISKAMSNHDDTFSSALETIEGQIPYLLPKKSFEYLSSGLIVCFWQLSLKDINYSKSLYEIEISKLESNTRSLKDSIMMNSRDKDVTRATIDKQRKELHENEEYIKILPSEMNAHYEHDNLIKSKLQAESSGWFLTVEEDKIPIQVEQFLQCCVLPRCIHSSFDAVFVSRFIFRLHKLKTKNYSLVAVLDQLTKSKILFGTLFTLTPTEAENLGLFFADILRTLQEWTNESRFKENEDLLDAAGDIISFDDFRKLLHGYHTTILEEIESSLGVTEYMSRRNAITFLKNLLGVYPTVEDHCERVVRLIEKIFSTEDREDLKLSSGALVGHVKSRAKSWLKLWEFIPMSDEEKEQLIKEKQEIQRKDIEKKLEEKRRLLELKKEEEKLAKEQLKEEELKKRTSAINYDSKKSSSRPDSRAASTSTRGRYDNYSRYAPTPKEMSAEVEKESDAESKVDKGEREEKKKDGGDNKNTKHEQKEETRDKTQRKRPTREQRQLNKEKVDKDDDLFVSKKDSEKTKSRDFQRENTSNQKLDSSEMVQSESRTAGGDLKSRLSQVKREFHQKASKKETPVDAEEGQAKPQPKNPVVVEQNTNGEESHVKKRVPLPPQEEIRMKTEAPLVPQQEVRSRVPLPPQEALKARATAPSAPTSRFSESWGGRGTHGQYHSYPQRQTQSNYNRAPSGARSTETKSSSTSRSTTNVPAAPAATPLPPPPPPPPPPISTKRNDTYNSTTYRNGREQYTRSDGYNNRNHDGKDTRQGGRYDNKRKQEGYGGRGYDKKSRY
ncbi:THO complex subunit 2 [Spathaspora sp. JA1]|nr:THO complex subunit 2 [Spathaspora sp. JA1]